MEHWISPILGLMGVALGISHSVLAWVVTKIISHERQLGERKVFSETRWDELQTRLHVLEEADDMKRRIDRLEAKVFNGSLKP